jgi:hypothetical protein
MIMARGPLSNRSLLLRELKSSLDEVDDLKADLRKAKKRVGEHMRKLMLHTQTHRNNRRVK